MLQAYPKGTRVGYSWAIKEYKDEPMAEYMYQSVYHLRSIAMPALIGVRDLFTDARMTREEQGDEKLDNVTKLQPLALGGSSSIVGPGIRKKMPCNMWH